MHGVKHRRNGGSVTGRELERIAREHLDIADLTEHRHDRLDFHEVHVNGVRAALEAAYAAGQEASTRAASQTPPRYPVRRSDGRIVYVTVPEDEDRAARRATETEV